MIRNTAIFASALLLSQEAAAFKIDDFDRFLDEMVLAELEMTLEERSMMDDFGEYLL